MRLKRGGAKVTALPLDAVFGARLAGAGIEVVQGTLAECFNKIAGRKFGAVVLLDLLHLLPAGDEILGQSARLVREGGVLVAGGPNFGSARLLVKRFLQRGYCKGLSKFEKSGVRICGPRSVAKTLRRSGLRVTNLEWISPEKRWDGLGAISGCAGKLSAEEWLLQATR